MLRTGARRTVLSAFSRPTQVNCLINPAFRRSYADAPAHSENLKLSFSVPHMSIFANKEVFVSTTYSY